MEVSTPRSVTLVLELILAVKGKGRAHFAERKTSAAISGKVVARVSQSGWWVCVCLGA